MGISTMGPASREYLDELAKTGNHEKVEADSRLFSDFSWSELEYVGRTAINDGNVDFADMVIQYFFEQGLLSNSSPHNLECAQAYSRLESQLDATRQQG